MKGQAKISSKSKSTSSTKLSPDQQHSATKKPTVSTPGGSGGGQSNMRGPSPLRASISGTSSNRASVPATHTVTASQTRPLTSPSPHNYDPCPYTEEAVRSQAAAGDVRHRHDRDASILSEFELIEQQLLRGHSSEEPSQSTVDFSKPAHTKYIVSLILQLIILL